MKKGMSSVVSLMVCFMMGAVCHGEQTILAKKADDPPVIDGVGDDSAWKGAGGVTTHDKVANLYVTLKAVYTDDSVFFLVVFPDPDESRIHKAWKWDAASESYKIGPEREDSFVLKWNMGSERTDLSLHADDLYTADIWFWKACRTDPMGFADDKIQKLSAVEIERAMPLTSRSGKTTYLKRAGDNGAPAYKNTLYIDYKGDRTPHFLNRFPKGSRADIRAKGIWTDGEWTIEFGRKLNTGHEDDVQLVVGERRQFGVSRFEIAGRPPDPALNQPLFGSGDVSETLFLMFEP